MNSNVINRNPYLITSRDFPTEANGLVAEVSRSYIDIANAVNNRTISLFPTTKPAMTGESWYLSKNQRQQTFRQVYTFTTTAAINHLIDTSDVGLFTAMYGTFTDGTNFYGLIAASNVAIPGQISFYITPTQIIFLVGAGAPALTNGLIVLEWLSQP